MHIHFYLFYPKILPYIFTLILPIRFTLNRKKFSLQMSNQFPITIHEHSYTKFTLNIYDVLFSSVAFPVVLRN